MKYNGLVITILIGSLFCLSGCASTSQWPEFSGFLKDYEGMYRSENMEEMFIVKDSGKNVTDYSTFIVDPVIVQFIPHAIAYNMNQSDLSVIVKDFRQAIIQALETNYIVVDNPGSGVLRVRVAVTDILERKGVNSKGIIEAEFVDTQTGKRVSAVMTSAKGMPLAQWAELLKNRLSALHRETKVYQFK